MEILYSSREQTVRVALDPRGVLASVLDRKSTRLNSSHSQISYAVFCLKKKKSPDALADRPSTARPRHVCPDDRPRPPGATAAANPTAAQHRRADPGATHRAATPVQPRV